MPLLLLAVLLAIPNSLKAQAEEVWTIQIDSVYDRFSDRQHVIAQTLRFRTTDANVTTRMRFVSRGWTESRGSRFLDIYYRLLSETPRTPREIRGWRYLNAVASCVDYLIYPKDSGEAERGSFCPRGAEPQVGIEEDNRTLTGSRTVYVSERDVERMSAADSVELRVSMTQMEFAFGLTDAFRSAMGAWADTISARRGKALNP